eukprot:Rhum_TRINITY_DN12632_c0_g1::Rhum_TRINITY_DN12632_c0_g1_i1::g.53327::m.53327
MRTTRLGCQRMRRDRRRRRWRGAQGRKLHCWRPCLELGAGDCRLSDRLKPHRLTSLVAHNHRVRVGFVVPLARRRHRPAPASRDDLQTPSQHSGHHREETGDNDKGDNNRIRPVCHRRPSVLLPQVCTLVRHGAEVAKARRFARRQEGAVHDPGFVAPCRMASVAVATAPRPPFAAGTRGHGVIPCQRRLTVRVVLVSGSTPFASCAREPRQALARARGRGHAVPVAHLVGAPAPLSAPAALGPSPPGVAAAHALLCVGEEAAAAVIVAPQPDTLGVRLRSAACPRLAVAHQAVCTPAAGGAQAAVFSPHGRPAAVAEAVSVTRVAVSAAAAEGAAPTRRATVTPRALLRDVAAESVREPPTSVQLVARHGSGEDSTKPCSAQSARRTHR